MNDLYKSVKDAFLWGVSFLAFMLLAALIASFIESFEGGGSNISRMEKNLRNMINSQIADDARFDGVKVTKVDLVETPDPHVYDGLATFEYKDVVETTSVSLVFDEKFENGRHSVDLPFNIFTKKAVENVGEFLFQ